MNISAATSGDHIRVKSAAALAPPWTLPGLTKGLARKLGKFGSTVNAIAPGVVVRRAEKRVYADGLSAYKDFILQTQSPNDRMLPADLANPAVIFASAATV